MCRGVCVCHAEESALLSQLAGRLHAASILAGGLLLTATQHDTCIAKLGLMQAVAVAAGVSRSEHVRPAQHAQHAGAAGSARCSGCRCTRWLYTVTCHPCQLQECLTLRSSTNCLCEALALAKKPRTLLSEQVRGCPAALRGTNCSQPGPAGRKGAGGGGWELLPPSQPCRGGPGVAASHTGAG